MQISASLHSTGTNLLDVAPLGMAQLLCFISHIPLRQVGRCAARDPSPRSCWAGIPIQCTGVQRTLQEHTVIQHYTDGIEHLSDLFVESVQKYVWCLHIGVYGVLYRAWPPSLHPNTGPCWDLQRMWTRPNLQRQVSNKMVFVCALCEKKHV